LTRIFTSLSIARFTGTRIFMMAVTGCSIGVVSYRARPLSGTLRCCGAGNLPAKAGSVNEHDPEKWPPVFG
jgi:hypothetical protein